jgi:hypothetical protein
MMHAQRPLSSHLKRQLYGAVREDSSTLEICSVACSHRSHANLNLPVLSNPQGSASSTASYAPPAIMAIASAPERTRVSMKIKWFCLGSCVPHSALPPPFLPFPLPSSLAHLTKDSFLHWCLLFALIRQGLGAYFLYLFDRGGHEPSRLIRALGNELQNSSSSSPPPPSS